MKTSPSGAAASRGHDLLEVQWQPCGEGSSGHRATSSRRPRLDRMEEPTRHTQDFGDPRGRRTNGQTPLPNATRALPRPEADDDEATAPRIRASAPPRLLWLTVWAYGSPWMTPASGSARTLCPSLPIDDL